MLIISIYRSVRIVVFYVDLATKEVFMSMN